MKRIVFPLLLILSLSACFGGGEPVPQDQFYRLSTSSYAGKPLQPVAKVIAVSTLDSDVLHRERAILFSHVDEPLKLQRYHYHHWTHIPARMVQDHLIDYLRTSGLAGEVFRYGEQALIDAEIGGQLKRFERVLGQANITVAVQLELYYRSRSERGKSIQQVYSEEVIVSNDSMHATADAFSKALEKIYNNFMNDIVTRTRS